MIAGDVTAINLLKWMVLVLVTTGGRVVGSPFPIRVGVVGERGVLMAALLFSHAAVFLSLPPYNRQLRQCRKKC